MSTKRRTSREELWDALSDILEETGTAIPVSLREAGIAAIARCQGEDHAPRKRAPQGISRGIRRDVRDLVAYNWDDEEADFKTSTRENGPQPGHIFHVLKRLNAFAR